VNYSDLPEWDPYEQESTETGDTILTRKSPKFIPHEYTDDEVLFFKDRDGWWTVMYCFEGGPYKQRIPGMYV